MDRYSSSQRKEASGNPKSHALSAALLCVYNTLPGETCSLNPQSEGPTWGNLLKNVCFFFFDIVAIAAALALSVSNLVDLADMGTNLPWEIPEVENLCKIFRKIQ